MDTGLVHLIAGLCRRHYVLRQIDSLFLGAGAQSGWRATAAEDHYSQRMNRVFGWAEGVERNAPVIKDRILRDVAARIMDGGFLSDAERAALWKRLAIGRPEGRGPYGGDCFQVSCAPRIGNVVLEAVMLIDLYGSTELTERIGNVRAARVKRALDRSVRSIAKRFSAAFVKGTGDGHFITFPSRLDAVESAIAIFQCLPSVHVRAGLADSTLRLRCGIAYGDLVLDDHGDRHGKAANLASRLEGLTTETLSVEPGGMPRFAFESVGEDRILVDASVFHGIEDTYGSLVRYVGLANAKGVGRPKRVYLVDWRAVSRVVPDPGV